MTEEEFPFNNQYYDLVTGKTLSKRGVWWTAILIVSPKPKEGDDEKKQENVKNKIIIQRWRRFKQGDQGGHTWRKSKDFTISSKKQWLEMKEIIDEWVEDNTIE